MISSALNLSMPRLMTSIWHCRCHATDGKESRLEYVMFDGSPLLISATPVLSEAGRED